MMGLLVLKEQLKAFYAKYSPLVNAAARFVVAFAACYMIIKNAGFMPKLNSPVVALLLGLLCAFLPYGAIAVLTGCFLLVQLYAASLEIAVITFAFLLIVVLLYYGFQPGDSILLVVTPVLFFLKVPFAVSLIIFAIIHKSFLRNYQCTRHGTERKAPHRNGCSLCVL